MRKKIHRFVSHKKTKTSTMFIGCVLLIIYIVIIGNTIVPKVLEHV